MTIGEKWQWRDKTNDEKWQMTNYEKGQITKNDK